MFEHFPQSKFLLVAQDGTVKYRGEGLLEAGRQSSDAALTITDVKLVIEQDDEIHRSLPNGRTEVYIVLDSLFDEGLGDAFPQHQVIRLRRKGTPASPPRGHGHTVHVTGPNARVNIGSHDQSVNVHGHDGTSVFSNMRDAIATKVPQDRRVAALEAVDGLEKAKGTANYVEEYMRFVGSLADHMTIIAPFLPAISQWLI